MGARKLPSNLKAKQWLWYVQKLRCKPVLDLDDDGCATPTALPTIMEMMDGETKPDRTGVVCCSPFETIGVRDMKVETGVVDTQAKAGCSLFDGGCVGADILEPFIQEVMDPQPDSQWDASTKSPPKPEVSPQLIAQATSVLRNTVYPQWNSSAHFTPLVDESQQLIDKASSVLNDFVQEVIDPQPATTNTNSALIPCLGH